MFVKERETVAVNELMMNGNSTTRPAAVTGTEAAAADDVTMTTPSRGLSAVDTKTEMLWTHLPSVNVTGLQHFTEYMIKVCLTHSPLYAPPLGLLLLSLLPLIGHSILGFYNLPVC